ncbi:MAG: hypothetical protein K0R54_1473 [Clostridiaceae bacterium]|nr:hypothetical protein [Clostridiaceae bacterium]
MKLIIDRFEHNFAVCEKEDRTMLNIEKSKLPQNAKEGDVIIISNDKIIIDNEETLKRKKIIENLTKDMWK